MSWINMEEVMTVIFLLTAFDYATQAVEVHGYINKRTCAVFRHLNSTYRPLTCAFDMNLPQMPNLSLPI